MNSGDKWLNLVGLAAAFLFGFLLVSFLTYAPAADPPASTGDAIHNAGGQLGAYLAHYGYRGLGPLVWFCLFLLGLFTAGFFLKEYSLFDGASLASWTMVLLGLSGLYGWWRPESAHFVPDYLMYRVRPLLGPAGSFLVFSFLTVAGFLLRPVVVLPDLLGRLQDPARRVYEETVDGASGMFRRTNQFVDWLMVLPDRLFSEPQASTSPESARTTDTVEKRSTPESSSSPNSDYDDDPSESSPESEDESSKEEPEADSSGANVIPFAREEDDDEDNPEETTNSSGEDEGDDDSSTKSPDDTESSLSGDPVEVEHERPEVDEADMSQFNMPRLDLLTEGEIREAIPDEETLQETAAKLEETFSDFGLEGEVVDVNPGPVLTMYEVEPGAGVSVKKFESRADDIKLNLAVESVRIVSPIPGKSALGIEVPNSDRALVRLRDVISSDEFRKDSRSLPLGLGLDVLGNPMVIDLASLPHLLVAGATGSGKSVGLNSMICSLIYQLPPDELKFIMIDPKRVELKLYDGLPHLMTPVIDDTSEATKVLKWAVREMENRYEVLSDAGMRDIDSYNEKVAGKDGNEKLPYLVLIVDELSDLMMTNPKECEQAITRLAQMARAVGIHMVLATQRPSTDVITGLIKANMPARLAYRVSSGTDSRVILDENGAETLLGNGDLLYLSSESPHPERGQGSFLSDEETKDLIKYVKEQVKPSYVDKEDLFGSSGGGNFDETMDDEYYEDAKELVVERQKASASMLQRRFRVGYNRAARMIDAMEEEGIVGPHRGSKARNVIVDKEEFLDDDE
jgi:S-DNA-T family DNA segregation ATPase FtsK/SpoIIIE